MLVDQAVVSTSLQRNQAPPLLCLVGDEVGHVHLVVLGLVELRLRVTAGGVPSRGRLVAGAEVTGPPVQVFQTLVLTTFGAAVTTTSSMTGPAAALTPIGDGPVVVVVLVKVSVVEVPVAANEKVWSFHFMSAVVFCSTAVS